ncbi:MAG: hypothetical protein JWO58_903 [Chitinophagaceae bacterium]|nr:hypothetical protein [Chitinophagaceae bacterium]
METIDINTPQNVTINYELASLRERIFAFIIDFITLFIACLVLFLLLTNSFGGEGQNILFSVLLLPLFLFYSLLFEILNNGKSLGKMALGIKVIKIDGTEGVAGDYMARWAFRSLELYLTVGSFAVIMVSLSDKNQRLGDLVANTVVVKERPAFNLSLAALLNKKTINEYQPVYPSVVRMSEEDVLFIKEVLERYRRYRNDAHREALKILVDKMKTRLEITTAVGRHEEFLLTLIKDYVVLTR